MTRRVRNLGVGLLALLAWPVAAQQAPAPTTPPPAAPAPPAMPTAQPAPPLFATRKVEGTDNVYIFRYQGHQSIFVVTPEGVIATDPIGYLRPQAVTAYLDEIRKVTSAPIRYLVYSHHHYDHIAGGKPFKDAGATVIAHRLAKERLAALKHPDVVIPDETVDDKRVLTLGGTELELIYVGRNHSDNSLVMRLPKERLIFTVDFLPIQTVQFRNMPDNVSPLEMEDSIRRTIALDWDRMIPGHPYAGGRLGTKKDAEDHLAYLRDLSADVKKAADSGKCFDTAMKEVKLPQYATLGNYEQYIAGNVERYCYWWGRGY